MFDHITSRLHRLGQQLSGGSTDSNRRKQEEELSDRTRELLEDNSQQVLRLLVSYSQSSGR